ncbi:hypothetical protein C8Q80DRAFT_1051416, partial [Daedaleopsis nitida]
LGEGKITVAALVTWENASERYFRVKKVVDVDQVSTAALQIENERVSQWYENDFARYNQMSWDEFTKALRKRFLPPT